MRNAWQEIMSKASLTAEFKHSATGITGGLRDVHNELDADPEKTKGFGGYSGDRETVLNFETKQGNESIIPTNAISAEMLEKLRGDENAKKKARKQNDFLLIHYLTANNARNLEAYILWLRREAAECEKDAEALRGKIADNIERQQENSDFIGEADTLLAQYEKNGKLDTDMARKLLRERGRDVDDNLSPALLSEILRKERWAADEENKNLDEENEVHDANAEKFETKQEELSEEADKLEVIRDKVQNGQTLTEEEQQELEENINTEHWVEFRKEQDQGIDATEQIDKKAKADIKESQLSDESADFMAAFGLSGDFNAKADEQNVEEDTAPEDPTSPSPQTPPVNPGIG